MRSTPLSSVSTITSWTNTCETLLRAEDLFIKSFYTGDPEMRKIRSYIRYRGAGTRLILITLALLFAIALGFLMAQFTG